MNAAPEIAFSSEQGKANYAAARRQYPAQAIVDLKTMRDNMAHLVSVVGGPASGTAVMGVVKADAYGHGLLPAALAAQKALDPDRNMLLDYDELKGLRAHFDDLLSPFMRVAVQGGYVRPR